MKNDPLGFYNNDPLGFNEKDPLGFGEEEKTTWQEDLAQGVAGLGNTGDRFLTFAGAGLASILGQNRGGKGEVTDDMFANMEERIRQRNDWAGGQGKEKGLSGHLISALPGLAGIPLLPVSGIDRSAELIQKGVPVEKAALAGAVDSSVNLAANAIPIVGKTLVGRGALGAASNMVSGGVTDAASNLITGGNHYDPLNFNQRMSEGLIGGVAGALIKNVETDSGTGLKGDLDAPLPIPEPKVDPRAQVLADMDAQLAAQKRAPVVADLDASLQRPPMSMEDQRLRAPTEQAELPLHSTPEQIAAHQVDPNQADMFVGNRLPDPVERPVGEMPTHQDTLPDFTTPEEISLHRADPNQPDMFHETPFSVEPKVEAPRPLTDTGTGERTGYTQGTELFPELPKDVVVPERPAIETAVDKLAKNQQFDMTATEKVAWEKAKGLVEEFDDGYNALSDRQIANKILDRQWVEDAMTKAEQVKAMFEDVEQKVASIAEKKEARARIEAMEDKLMQLQKHLEDTAYKVDKQGQGPKTRAAQAEQNPGFRTGIPKRRVPKGQLGAVDFGDATRPKEDDRIRFLAPDSPDVGEAMNRYKLNKQRGSAARIAGLKGYDSIVDSPEQVIGLAKDEKDISPGRSLAGRSVSAGINNVAINTNNSLIRFTANQIHALQSKMDELARVHITDKKTGLRATLDKMSQREKNAAHALLLKGDRDGMFMTREQMQSLGATENTIRFVEKIYEIDKVKLDVWNKARAEIGMEPVEQRPGHYPGVFKGDYKTLVYKTGKDGEKHVVGVVATDTYWGNLYAQNKIKKEHGDVTFTRLDRRSLGGNGQRSDLFSGVSDLMQILGKDNPEIAKINEIVRSAVKEHADALYGAQLHSLGKKGVFGSQGDKSWKSANANTNEAIKAYINYWEEGIISHLNLPVESKLKAMMENPALDHMPNAKNYINDYIKNYTGRNLGKTGEVLNGALDTPFRLIGVGPTAPRAMVNQFNKRAGQIAMAYGNVAFSAIQLAQVAQMAAPEMMRVARLAGGNQVADPMKAMGTVIKDSIELFKAHKGMENSLDSTMKQAVIEAKKRGINQLSEFKDVNAVTQNKFSRRADQAIDFTRSLPESVTRSFVYYSFVKMLEGSVPKERLYDVAYNATQSAMIDYSLAERPQMYQRLGTVGNLAGSLQTFKHGYLGQQGKLYGDAIKGIKTGDFGAALPAAVSGVVAMSLAGIMGFPLYQELDWLTKKITSLYGPQKNIEELALENSPEWAKRGLLSAETGVNFQSRLSAANVLPDSLPEAFSPYAGMAANMGSAIGNVASNVDNPDAWKHLAYTFTPNGPMKKFAEDSFHSRDGIPLDASGRLANEREPKSKFEKFTGFTPLDVAKTGERQHYQMERQTRMQDKLKSLTAKATYATRTGQMNQEKFDQLRDEYMKFEGDPEELIKAIKEEYEQSKLTRQQRLQGVPKEDSVSSVRRWLNFQP